MLLSAKDFDLLKILCWCKSMPVGAGTIFKNKYPQEDILALNYFGLLSLNKNNRMIRPRSAAFDLLEGVGVNHLTSTATITNAKMLPRRNITAQILYTFHAAGVSVFNTELRQRIDEPLYIASFAARNKDDGNPFGSTRFHGIFCTPQEAFPVFYVDDYGIFYKNEMRSFNNYIHSTGINKRTIIMMGGSTSKIANEVLAKKKSKAGEKLKPDTFAHVLKITTLPVIFIPMGDEGAQIIKFLLIPNYREEVAKALLSGSYKPRYEGLWDTDTIHFMPPFNPVIISLALDINRIDRAIESSKCAGFEKIVIYALPEQMAFLKSRYAGKADVLGLNIDNLKKVLSHNIDLYEPPASAYVIDEGRCFDVSAISAYRKAGKKV